MISAAVIGGADDVGQAGVCGGAGSGAAGVLDGGVSAGVVGVVGAGMLLVGLLELEKEKVPFVAKAMPPIVNIMTIKAINNTMVFEEVFFCGIALGWPYVFCCW